MFFILPISGTHVFYFADFRNACFLFCRFQECMFFFERTLVFLSKKNLIVLLTFFFAQTISGTLVFFLSEKL